MTPLLFEIALCLTLISSGGFIVYIFKYHQKIFNWSFLSLLTGFIVHTISIGVAYYYLGTAPVITLKSSLSFFAWTIIAAYFILYFKFRLLILGSFVAPFAAFFMIVSSLIAQGEVHVTPIYQSIWLPIHVGAAFVGNGMFAVNFIASAMYLIQEKNIKGKSLGPLYDRLPSLESMDSLCRFSLVYGFPFLTVGMLTGAFYAQQALGSYWRWDPKEVWTLITWFFYAILLHERLAVGLRGKRAAWVSIIAFFVLVFTFLGASLWLSDYHSFKNLEGMKG